MKVIIILVVVVVLIVLIAKRNKSVNDIVPTSPLPDTNQSLPASNMLDIDNFYDLEKDKTTYSEVKDIFTERGVSFSERTDLDGKPFLVFRLNALGIDWDGKVEFKDGKVWYYNLCTYRKDSLIHYRRICNELSKVYGGTHIVRFSEDKYEGTQTMTIRKEADEIVWEGITYDTSPFTEVKYDSSPIAGVENIYINFC